MRKQHIELNKPPSNNIVFCVSPVLKTMGSYRTQTRVKHSKVWFEAVEVLATRKTATARNEKKKKHSQEEALERLQRDFPRALKASTTKAKGGVLHKITP